MKKTESKKPKITVEQLRETACELKIKNYKDFNKEQLEAAIEKEKCR